MHLEAKGIPSVYRLKGIVVHEGQGLAFGHYYSIVKSQGKWIKFDDTRVHIISDAEAQTYFGEPPVSKQSRMGWPCAYMLLYESVELLDEYYEQEIQGQEQK